VFALVALLALLARNGSEQNSLGSLIVFEIVYRVYNAAVALSGSFFRAPLGEHKHMLDHNF